MRALLEKKFLPYIMKPGRYVGGEPGQIVKEPEGRLNYLIAFPDKYELGQSYLGLQTLYHVVNKDDRFLAERVFAVDLDAEEIMRRENIPLFSLESSRPAGEFDAIGFTLPFELVFTNVLAMLDLAGIPLRSKDRSDDHPLIFAGGPAVYNPEPMAHFFDVVFIGDAEEGLPEMLSILHELKGRTRMEKLQALAQRVESVYIPQFYDNKRNPLTAFAPGRIKARLMKQLKPEYYPDQPILPMIDTVHSHLGVEIMRGCPQGCRFCQAGPIYRPVRVRPVQDIMRQIETQIKNTGYNEVSLVSLSTSDHPDIDDLADRVSRRFEGRRISISLPALRPGTISPVLLEAAKRVRIAGLTLAPEAGTERLRQFIRKDILDSTIFDTVRIAFEKGWTTLKLYFMIGLPTETDDDLLGIVSIIRKVSKISEGYAGKKTINVMLSPFVPKPHTPFQWDPIISPEEMLRRIYFVKHNAHVRGVYFKHHNCEAALLQGILGRGDRELADVIEAVYHKGCRFDGWSENFEQEKWFQTIEEKGITKESFLKAIPFNSPLPWGHILKGPSVEHLRTERNRTSTEIKYTPLQYNTEKSENRIDTPPVRFGRGKKKTISRNLTAPTKNCVRLRWGKTARYRYMSHLDNMRAIERALRRADVPVAYSLGFNPSMKLSFCPPLPLGFTSEAEYVDITLEATLMPYMIDNLKATMPPGLDILEARAVVAKKQSLSAAVNRAVYLMPLDDIEVGFDLSMALRDVMNADNLEVERQSKGKKRTVNVRPAIYDLTVKASDLRMVLGVGDGGYVRPSEVANLIFSESGCETGFLPFHRQDLYKCDNDGIIIRAMDL